MQDRCVLSILGLADDVRGASTDLVELISNKTTTEMNINVPRYVMMGLFLVNRYVKCVCVCMHIHTYIHTYIYDYICIYIYVYISVCTYLIRAGLTKMKTCAETSVLL